MTVADAKPKAASTYERDFYEWTREQVEMLRAQDWGAVDVERLIEELCLLADEAAVTLESALIRVAQHLLKLEYSPAEWPRRGWRLSVVAHRRLAKRSLRKSPSLRRSVDIEDIYQDARVLAGRAMQEYDSLNPAILPAVSPYTLDQLLDDDWWPASRHGLSA